MALSGSDKALMQSRAGVARAGATRFGYFDQITFLTVAGTDVTDALLWETLEWNERIGNEPDTVRCILRGRSQRSLLTSDGSTVTSSDGSTLLTEGALQTPVEGNEIVLSIGASDRDVFNGPIIRVDRVNDGPTGELEGLYYEVEATDENKIVGSKRVIGRYTGSASSIVSSIIGDYASGFTTNNVKAGAPTIDEITFKYASVADALNRIAERVGWYWYVRDSDIHFFDTESGQQAKSLTEPDLSFYLRSLKVEDSGSQVRNRAIVEGQGSLTDAAVTAGATSIHVEQADAFDDLLNGSYDGIAVIGVNEFTFTGVTFDAGSTGPGDLTGIPASGAGSIADNWNPGTDVNIIVKVNDTAAQSARAAVESGDGIYEVYIRDRRLSPEGCEGRGQQELDIYADTITQGRYTTRDRFARSGRTVTINLPTGWAQASQSFTITAQNTRWRSRTMFERDVEFGPIRRDFTRVIAETKREPFEAG